MIIIADENIPILLQEKLIANGFSVVSIFNDFRGITDFKIIELAQSYNNAIILTEDKDFGEWVFAHHIKNLSVVFLRYHFKETDLALFIDAHAEIDFVIKELKIEGLTKAN
jgi:predicted nuclease of predicted toxin-antitoxin system